MTRSVKHGYPISVRDHVHKAKSVIPGRPGPTMYDDQIGPIALLNVMDLPTGDFDKLSVGRETKLCLGFIQIGAPVHKGGDKRNTS